MKKKQSIISAVLLFLVTALAVIGTASVVSFVKNKEWLNPSETTGTQTTTAQIVEDIITVEHHYTVENKYFVNDVEVTKDEAEELLKNSMEALDDR